MDQNRYLVIMICLAFTQGADAYIVVQASLNPAPASDIRRGICSPLRQRDAKTVSGNATNNQMDHVTQLKNSKSKKYKNFIFFSKIMAVMPLSDPV